MKTNILVEYDGGGYDGCIWEWNYFYIDENGVFEDIFSSGSGGITNLENALDLIKNNGNSFSNKIYVYHLDNKEDIKTFAKESACPNVKMVIDWFNAYNSPIAEPFAICSQCQCEITYADEIHLIDIHGCGGIMSTADNLLCYECYYLGVCGWCDEFVGQDDVFYLGGEYAFDDDYKNKAARKMLDDGYTDVCGGCLDYQAGQIEQDEHFDMVWASMTTGTPDMFSDDMRWFWGLGI